MSQRLFVPYIGSVLVLAEEWGFNLYFESRNRPLLKALWKTTMPGVQKKDGQVVGLSSDGAGCYEKDWEGHPFLRTEKAMSGDELENANRTFRSTRGQDKRYVAAFLPAGTPLRVDRVYIRRGIDAYSSLTFVVAKECYDKNLRGKRFWARLNDVNRMVCEVI